MIFKGKGLKAEHFKNVKPMSKIETRCLVERNSIKWKGVAYKSEYLKDVNNEGVSVFEDEGKLWVVYKENTSTICSFNLK